MKAVQLKAYGIAHLEQTTLPDPVPGHGEVLIKLEAVSLNYRDLASINGLYGPDLLLPYVPVSDGAGTVVAIGSGVTRWKTGDRVMTHFIQQWWGGPNRRDTNGVVTSLTTPGVLSEYAVFPEGALVATPAHLDNIAASTLPIAGLTAWAGLIDHAGIKAGDVVLTQGTGGVSIFALQIARATGARVIATTGSAHKAARLLELGASDVINYKEDKAWHETVLRLTGGEGVHATLDIAGTESVTSSLKSVRLNGFVGLIGFISGAVLPVDFFTMVTHQVRLQGIMVGSRESFDNLSRALVTSNIQPVIDQVFPMEDTKAAFTHFASGAHFGKVVITL